MSPWPHAVGFVLAAIGFAYLIARYHHDASTLAVMSVYGCGLLTAFGASALYHAIGGSGQRRNAVLRRIDHAAIFALIAGSYTPILYFGLDGVWRLATMLAVACLSTIGIVLAIWFVHTPRAVSTSFYIALGWAAIIPAMQLSAALSHTAIVLIIVGGVLYSVGGAVYATRSLNFLPGRFGFHEVFHVLVVAGAAVHYVAIAFALT